VNSEKCLPRKVITKFWDVKRALCAFFCFKGTGYECDIGKQLVINLGYLWDASCIFN